MGRFSVPLIKEQKGIIFMNAIRRTPACRHDRPALAFLYLPKHHRRQVTLKKKKKRRDYKPVNFNPIKSTVFLSESGFAKF